jgi:MFS family permease
VRPLLKDLPREVGVLGAVAVAVAVGFGIVAPAIPVFAREFGVGRTAAGAVISAFAFARLVFALAGGRLVDRFGERLILAVGIGIVAVSSALAGLSQSYGQLLALRGIGGVGSAMFSIAAISLVLRVAGPEQRGRATGVFQGGFLLGGVAGPPLGGVVASWSIRAPFFLYAGTLAVAGGIAMVYLARAEMAEKAAGDAAPLRRTTLPEAMRQQPYRAALTSNFGVGWTLFGVRSSLLPLFVVEAMQRDLAWAGYGLFVSAAAQAVLLLPGGRITDTVGRRPAMLWGTALAVASCGLLAVSASLPAYLMAMVLFGAGFALLSPASAAVVGDVAGGRGGTVVAGYQMAADIGAVIGPLAAGWLADNVSYGVAWGVSGGVLALGLVMAAVMPETRRSPGPEPAAA